MTEAELEWVRQEFARCKPWIQAALDRSTGEHAIEHVWANLENGNAQIWPTPNACMVTLVETGSTGIRILKGWLSGGDLEEIQVMEPKIRDWAKRSGCQKIIIAGRRGWLRAFEGYSEVYTVIVRTI